MKDIFQKEITDELIHRLNQLQPDSKPLWGKMNTSQMLAHCSVTYEMVYSEKYPTPNSFKKFILKVFVKNMVVNDKPYKRNTPTSPEFIIKETRDFENERTLLIDYLITSQSNGNAFFEGKESHSFGKLTSKEWNNMFYKHLDHHLSQFGV